MSQKSINVCPTACVLKVQECDRDKFNLCSVRGSTSARERVNIGHVTKNHCNLEMITISFYYLIVWNWM